MVPGPDTVLKLILAILAVFIIVVVIGVFVNLVGPIYSNVVDVGLLSELGWGVPHTVVLLFAAISLIAIGVTILFWWVLSPVRDDVRQEQTRGGL